MEKKVCPQCEKELEDGIEICPNCGKILDEDYEKMKSKEKKARKGKQQTNY